MPEDSACSTVIVNPSSVSIRSSVFFDNWSRSEPLPTPSHVKCHSTGYAETLFSNGSGGKSYYCQTVSYYEELGLVVKYGTRTTIAEGQTLWLIRKHCPEISHLLPEVYGWATEGDEIFMYLSYIPGDTLQSCMKALSEQDLDLVAQQLHSITSSWRKLRLPPDDMFIGTPDRKPIRDQIWWDTEVCRNQSSALLSVAELNELHDLCRVLPQFPQHQYFRSIRTAFPDACAVCLTHTDLAPSNIILSPTSLEVVGIVDWQESGWYPEFWEYLKLRYHALGKWIEVTDRRFGNVYCREFEAFDRICLTGII